MRARSFRVIFRVFSDVTQPRMRLISLAPAKHWLLDGGGLLFRKALKQQTLVHSVIARQVFGSSDIFLGRAEKTERTFQLSSHLLEKFTNTERTHNIYAWTFRSFHPINSRWGNFWKKKRTKMAVCPRDGVDKVSTALITGENRGRPPTRSQVAVIRPFGGSVVSCFGPSRIPSCHLPRLSMYKWQNTFIEPKWLSTREFRYSKR